MVKSSGALGNYQYDLTQFAVKEAGRAIDLQQAAAQVREQKDAERKKTEAIAAPASSRMPQPSSASRAPSPTPAPPASPPPPAVQQQVITHRHELVMGGRQYNVGTDAAGSGELQQLMSALERDANLAGGIH